MPLGKLNWSISSSPIRSPRKLAVECLEARAVPAGAELSELVTIITGATTHPEGLEYYTGGAAYSFRLASTPSAPVTITLVADDDRIAIGGSEDNTFVLPGEEYVDLHAKEDTLVTGTRTASIDVVLTSEDPRFNGVFKDQIQLTVIENDHLVTSTADSGPGSLRQAIADSQQSIGLPTFRFAPSLAGQTIRLQSALASNNEVSIDASDLPGGMVIEPEPRFPIQRFFDVTYHLQLKNLTLRGFGTGANGGAISVAGGFLRVEDCVFEGNQAVRGGAISVDKRGTFSTSNVEITNTRFGGENEAAANRASADGGAVYIAPGAGQVLIRDSVFGNNRAEVQGGAIASHAKLFIVGSTFAHNKAADGGGINAAAGELFLVNSTVSGNVATQRGGGLINQNGDVEIISSTIVANIGEQMAGGILAENATSFSTTLRSSIVAGNLTGPAGDRVPSDLAGYRPATSWTLISDPASALGISYSSGNIVGKPDASGELTYLPLDEVLFPLAHNGGPTQTHALRPGSPAINRGRLAVVPFPSGSDELTTDQRGAGFPRLIDAVPDMGALEFQPNRSPVIESPAWLYVLPGRSTVATIAASDIDEPRQTLSYLIIGGDDSAAFELSANGVLTFATVPDPADPMDADGDNRYQVEIAVRDSWGATTTQQLTVVVYPKNFWHNETSPTDVDGDGHLAPIDALIIINELNSRSLSDPMTGELSAVVPTSGPTYFYDVDGDGFAAAIDALIIINKLNRMQFSFAPQTAGEGEFASAPRAGEPTFPIEEISPIEPERAIEGHELRYSVSMDLIAQFSWFPEPDVDENRLHLSSAARGSSTSIQSELSDLVFIDELFLGELK